MHWLGMQWHEIKCFMLQESTDRMCLGTCLLHNIAISFVSEYDHHPSVRHVSTHQGISLGRKSVHVHRSETHFMEQVVLYLHICKLSLINCSRIQAGGVA